MHASWSLLSLGLAVVHAKSHDEPKHLPNANHIFNAVHSSMRQWGSSLNHNGMSLFIATVPEGTQLYHGTSQAERINGTQWLAFEPEHASVFARPRRGGPPGRGGPHGPENDQPDGDDWHPPEIVPKNDLKARHLHEDLPLTHTAAQRARARLPSEQKPLATSPDQQRDEPHGYLHTYVPNRDLRLLYIDGQSAAKSDKGTLDMQDVVLLHNSPPPKNDNEHGPRHARSRGKQPTKGGTPDDDRKPGGGKRMGGPMSEGFRAEHLCDMAAKEWKGRIDGFLRMELGFEIILCSFEKDLDIERITEVKQSSGPGGPGGPGHDEGSFSYYQAVASRFDGIGGDRVRVDYGNFVSLFADEKAIFFDNNGLPRVRNESATLEPVLESITRMVLKNEGEDSTDWQTISDMVVARYADRIEYLASGEIKDLAGFRLEVDQALRPFTDYGARDTAAEIRRCATQYISRRPKPTDLAAHAIINVTATLCSRLTTAGEQTTLSEALATAQHLKEWLAWTTWKRCRGCSYHEVCFIPIWPMGSAEERENPRCVSSMSETSRGYWDGMGGPPHGKGFN